jgi:acetoacetate decarboxylase
MKNFYAKQGEIPKQGEIWLPVGDKGHLMMIHMIDTNKVKSFIPEELDIVSLGFGKTLGLVFMTSMGPESTLPYHELIIAPALIRAKGRYGFYVTHIYVDNEKSRVGGMRNFGLPKQMVDFVWNWESHEPGEIKISQKDRKIMTIRYEKATGSLPLKLGGNAVSILDDKLIFCTNSFKASFGISKVTYDIPSDSPVHRDMTSIGLRSPIFSILGENMKGYMGENTQVLAFLPNRSRN